MIDKDKSINLHINNACLLHLVENCHLDSARMEYELCMPEAHFRIDIISNKKREKKSIHLYSKLRDVVH